MKTSLMPPALAVVRTRIGRVGQESCAVAQAVDAAKATSVAESVSDERRTDEPPLKERPRHCERSEAIQYCGTA